MIEPGQTLSNPVTKERMTFLRTAAQTGGDDVLIELRSEPGGFVAAAHTHPSQTEKFGGTSPALQRLGLALGSPIGRLLGYEPVDVPAGVPAVQSA